MGIGIIVSIGDAAEGKLRNNKGGAREQAVTQTSNMTYR